MCLSTVYTYYDEDDGDGSVLCEYVSGVESEGGSLTFTDILGNETKVAGALRRVDLVKNRIEVLLERGAA